MFDGMKHEDAVIRPILLDLIRAQRSSVPRVAAAALMSETTLRKRLSAPETFQLWELTAVAKALGTTRGSILAKASPEARR